MRVVALPAAARNDLANELAALNAQLNDIARQRPVDPRRVFDIDKEFHDKIVEAAEGQRLLALHRSVRPQVERYWRLYAGAIVHDLQVSVSEHNEIIRAIRKGDLPGVQKALAENWSRGLDRVSTLIDLFGERGSW